MNLEALLNEYFLKSDPRAIGARQLARGRARLEADYRAEPDADRRLALWR